MSDGTLNGESISVIPINSSNKRPMIDTWEPYQKRVATPEEIQKWKDELKPEAWAIVLGDVSGRLFVVDVDSPIAEETVIGRFIRAMPKTFVVETSPGKRHYYFRDTSDVELKTKGFLNKSQFNDEQLPHVDLKAEGGYVLLPGSRHPAGHIYQVLEDNPIAEASYASIVFILKTLNKHWPIVQKVRPSYVPGGRNQICVGLSAFLYHHGFTVEEAIVLITALYYATKDTGDLHKALTDVKRTFTLANEGAEVAYQGFLPEMLISELQSLDKRYVFSTLRVESEKEKIDSQLKKLTPVEDTGLIEEPKALEKPLPNEEGAELDPRLMQWLETATYEDVRKILIQHIKLPSEASYDEILLISNQTRLMKILPIDSVVYVGILGEFSSAKTYLTKIITFLSDGEMVVDPTPAYILRQIGMNPGMTLGIDEVDQLVRDRNNQIIISILRMGNSWEAWRGFVEETEQKGKSKKLPVKINIGGPKVFNGYDSIDKALLSRTLTIDMKRWRDIDMVVEKMLGHPKLKVVRLWLQHRCEQALTKWNPDSVEQVVRSPEFKQTVDLLTKDVEIPRSMEIVAVILLLGKILDIDTKTIIEHYIEGLDRTTAQADIYKDFVSDIYRSLISGGWTNEPKVYGFAADHEASSTPWRINKIKKLEVQATYMWKVMSMKLQEANRASAINERSWYSILSELGFSKGTNWLKETKRGAWRNKQYLVFDDRILKTLGVD